MLAASLFFPTRDALVASRARAAQPA
jgi:hypothetical protein